MRLRLHRFVHPELSRRYFCTNAMAPPARKAEILTDAEEASKLKLAESVSRSAQDRQVITQATNI